MTTRMRWRWIVVLVGVVAAGAAAGPVYRWWQTSRRTQLFTQCRTALEEGRWSDLQTLAAPWSQWDPQNADPWLYLAAAAQARDELDLAAECLSRIPDDSPKVIPALLELLALQFGPLNRPREGAATCERAVRIEPRTTEAHNRLIQYFALSRQRARLARQIRESIRYRREPREAYVYLMLLDTLRLSNGIAMNERWLEAVPEDETFLVGRAMNLPEPTEPVAGEPAASASAGSVPADGVSRAAEGRTKLEMIDQLYERFPDNLELLAYKIDQCITIGDAEGVAELQLSAPDAAADDSRFWRFKGWLHESRDEIPEAHAAYLRALELHPLDWNTLNRLSQVERRRQNVKEVERLTALVEQATRIRRNLRNLPAAEMVTPDILADLAVYAQDCGDQQVAEALEWRLRSWRK
ncbi:MAG: hypothetical protein ACKV0T_11745 [Planctomycetales bacterium]